MDDSAPRFEADVKPLFRASDRSAMTFLLDLWDYDDVKANGDDILAALESGEMPCDGAWPADRVGVVRRWIEGGSQP